MAITEDHISYPNGRTDPVTEKSVIVVTHPDDEILWFSSVLEQVDHVIFCYADVPGNPKLTNTRRTLARAYPLMNSYGLSCARSVTRSIDQKLKQTYVEQYKQHGCWIWHNNYESFDDEVFYINIKLKDEDLPAAQQPRLNWLRVDAIHAFRARGLISKELLIEDGKCAIPGIIDGYTLEKSGDHYLLAGTGPRVGTTISNSAAVILGLCDGIRTVTEIVSTLSDGYSCEIKDIEADVHDTFVQCYRRDILVMSFYPLHRRKMH